MSDTEPKSRLTDKQRVFVEEYLKCWNATEAARRAGYSERLLHTNANKILQNTTVAAEIKGRIDEKAMSADELLTRVAEHARGNLADYVDDYGEVDVQRLKADGLGHLLKKYKKTRKTMVTKDGREYETEYTEVELYPADAAHDKLMKYHGLYDTKPVLGDKERPIEIRIVNDR